MNGNTISEAKLAAYLSLGTEGAGFALPLFREGTDESRWLAQTVDEVSGEIADFKVLDGDVVGVSHLQTPATFRVGGPPVYVFLSEDGMAHSGALSEIAPVLQAFRKRCPENVGVNLQIAELIGEGKEKADARLAVRRAILAGSGERAAHAFYERSALRSVLWEQLIAHAPDKEAARRILTMRKWTDARVGIDGEITLDLSRIEPSDYGKTNPGELIEKLKSDFAHVTGLRPQNNLPEPESGMVVHLNYRPADGSADRKRPACIILVRGVPDPRSEKSPSNPPLLKEVVYLPLSDKPPRDKDTAIELPVTVVSNLGLKQKPTWMTLSECNISYWPNEISKIPGTSGKWLYGFIPPRFFGKARELFRSEIVRRQAAIVNVKYLP